MARRAGMKVPGSPQGFYLASNDEIDVKLAYSREPVTFIGIGNPGALAVLYETSKFVPIRRVIFLDVSDAQLKYLDRMLKLISTCAGPADFAASLFCVDSLPKQVNSIAQGLTETASVGQPEESDILKFENLAWESFDQAAFHERYGLESEVVDGGIMVKGMVMGGFDQYRLSFFTPEKRNADGVHQFGMGYGRSYLRDAGSFLSMKKLLNSAAVSLHLADAAEELWRLVDSNLYQPLVLWTSNLLIKPFETPGLIQLRERLLNAGVANHDIRLLQARHGARILPAEMSPERPHRSWSNHQAAFRAVRRWLANEGIHVVGRVSELDKSAASIPGFVKTLPEELSAMLSAVGKVETIFLHLIAGYSGSMSRLRETLRVALASAETVVVLEHDARDGDFAGKDIAIRPDDLLREFSGCIFVERVLGSTGLVRNVVLVFGKKLPDFAKDWESDSVIADRYDPSNQSETSNDKKGMLERNHFEELVSRLNHSGCQALELWIGNAGIETTGAASTYVERLAKRELLTAANLKVARKVIALNKPSRIFEIGSGYGQLLWLLAAFGFETVGFECQIKRIQGARLLTASVEKDMGKFAGSIKFVEGIYPWTLSLSELSRNESNILIACDVISSHTESWLDAIVRSMHLFDYVFLDMATFGIGRKKSDLPDLIRLIASHGLYVSPSTLASGETVVEITACSALTHN